MNDERLKVYLASLDSGDSEYLAKLRQFCIETEVPIIRDDMKLLVKYLMKVKTPESVLEIGTAVGYSAILMAENAPSCRIKTIENYEPRFELAEKHIGESGYSGRIQTVFGDAEDILKEMPSDEQYDFIFMDAAKGQYINIFPYVLQHLKVGAALLSDNCFFDGDIIESKYLIKRRNRTIHKRMREYLYTITHDDRLSSIILPVGDGAAVSTRMK